MTLKKKLFFSLLVLIFFLALTVVADRTSGIFLRPRTTGPGLIFPPGSDYLYQTPEFTFRATINSLGFRDREFALRKTKALRILAIGDSLTFGWGVEAPQSWPKALESDLQAKGHDVEVLNLGKPGGDPTDYAQIATKAVPALKPDLVIVAVTEGDDLAQLDPSNNEPPPTLNPRQVGPLQKTLWRLYPYTMYFLQEHARQEPLKEVWKADAQRVIKRLSPDERARFEALDSRVKEMFVNGELNPAMMRISITRPDYFLKTLDISRADVKDLIGEMGKQLATVKRVAQENGSDIMVVPVPVDLYVSPSQFEARRRLGFNLVPEMLESNSQDDAIKSASDYAGVPFYTVTKELRQAARLNSLYFEFDGHFNALGYQTFAHNLAPIVEGKIRTK